MSSESLGASSAMLSVTVSIDAIYIAALKVLATLRCPDPATLLI